VTGSADDAAERLAEIIEAHEDGRDDTLIRRFAVAPFPAWAADGPSRSVSGRGRFVLRPLMPQ
jgi:hypothetical protein